MARILVIDDDDQIRRVLRRALEAEGHEVLEAGNGKTALRVHRTSPAELVITDIHMPEMSGIELATSIRKIRPETKVLFISGYSVRAFSPQTGTEMGAAFLQKPCMPHLLSRKVREVLDGSEAGVG